MVFYFKEKKIKLGESNEEYELYNLRLDNHLNLNDEAEDNFGVNVLKGNATIIINYENKKDGITELTVGNLSYSIYNYFEFDSLSQLSITAGDLTADDHYLTSSFSLLEDELEFFYGRIVTLDKIRIFKEYRNLGIGSAAILELEKILDLMSVDYIISHPAPIEKLENDISRNEIIDNLITFYKKLDFVEIKIPNEESIILKQKI